MVRASKLRFHVGAAQSVYPRVRMTRRRMAVPAALIAGALAAAAPASAALSAPAAGTGPVAVAVVMPVTVPPTATGLIDAAALTTYTEEGGLLDRELDAVAGTSAAVGLDPMIPVSIRVLGTSAPTVALDFLARLQAMPNDVFLLGYADADPALAAVAGASAELTPIGFGFAIDPANFGPAQTPSASPTPDPTGSPTPDPTTPPDGPQPLPTTEDLLEWPTTLPRIAWPADDSVTADGLAGLAEQGYDDVLVSGANVSTVSTARVALGDIEGLVADEDLTAAVRDAAYAATDTEFAAAEVTLEAVLRAEALTSPGRTLIATLDRRWPFTTLRLPEVLNSITASSSSRLASLTEVLEGSRGTATLVEAADDTDAERAATLGAIATAARDEVAYLRIAEDAAEITEPRRLALLGLTSVGWRADRTGWDAAAADELAAARATPGAVQIVEGSDLFLISDISSLRLQISNGLPVGVTVTLNVRPLRPLLHIEDRSIQVSIEPDSTANAAVPVEAIINGDVTVRAELRDDRGDPVGSPRLLKVIVQAGWETAGTLIAGVLVVLIFGGGLIRAVLKRRRAAAAGVPDSDD